MQVAHDKQGFAKTDSKDLLENALKKYARNYWMDNAEKIGYKSKKWSGAGGRNHKRTKDEKKEEEEGQDVGDNKEEENDERVEGVHESDDDPEYVPRPSRQQSNGRNDSRERSLPRRGAARPAVVEEDVWNEVEADIGNANGEDTEEGNESSDDDVMIIEDKICVRCRLPRDEYQDDYICGGCWVAEPCFEVFCHEGCLTPDEKRYLNDHEVRIHARVESVRQTC